uniref:peptidoglycan glycosyltransferase n=1 Tax=Nephroselmis olivacea TaxID=31312 RepID=Q9T468_NEPOL|nr:plastid division protein [Nephroselmis olivacea]NP_050933.1 plastid division protein [Nephroselmis olivacea]AAD54885.1 putative plastid division protein [Nephroselmis olivacea]AAD54904.1 putative plastid division protein [Nephroselmis olivacea]
MTSFLFFRHARRWNLDAQWIHWLTFLWVSVGLWMLTSASCASAYDEFGDSLYYVRRQILWMSVGFCQYCLILGSSMDAILMIGRWGFVLTWVGVCYTLIGGIAINGSSRWVAIGPLLFQPSELVKPFLTLEAASLFSQWHPRSFWWIRVLILILLVIAILVQPNLSTATLCASLLWFMAWMSGRPRFQLLQIAAGGVLVGCLSIFFRSYQRERVLSFWNPWGYSNEEGYQLVQSLLAVGSGGFQGVGWGLSHQKLFYLPIESTDFIFSVVSEESGWIGSILIVILVMTYSWVGASIVMRLRDPRDRLIALGSLFLLLGQSAINIGVCLGLFPTTGLPFPFISYGGNSILSSSFLVALLVRVSRRKVRYVINL